MRTDYQTILSILGNIDPKRYGRTRNFIDGAVTRLSPYISRGVISTKQVLKSLVDRGINPLSVEKFVQELAWRDYWQRLSVAHGTAILEDLRHAQTDTRRGGIPTAILEGATGIEGIDKEIQAFYQTGYMHNHVRMYVAGLVCNTGKCDWKLGAKWMYYHLLDADWASNYLSWQWVAGTSRNRQYIANQDNVNKYCRTQQTGTFLDVDYQTLADMPLPLALSEISPVDPTVFLPETLLSKTTLPELDRNLPTAIYTPYNLDPLWRTEEPMNRVLLMEPSLLRKLPMAEKTLQFITDLADNISALQVFSGEFGKLFPRPADKPVYFKEHPLTRHFIGNEDPRDWMFKCEGPLTSFFAYWKQGRKELVGHKLKTLGAVGNK